MVQQIIAILLVFGLLAGTLALLRRKGIAQFSTGLPRPKSRPKQMRVVERIALSPHHALHLIDIENRRYLIGVSPSGCNRIATLCAEEQEAAE